MATDHNFISYYIVQSNKRSGEGCHSEPELDSVFVEVQIRCRGAESVETCEEPEREASATPTRPPLQSSPTCTPARGHNPVTDSWA